MATTTRFEQHPSFVWEIRNFPKLINLESPDFFVENAMYKLKLNYGQTPCEGKCLQIRLERMSGELKRLYVCVDLSRETQKNAYKPFRSFARGFDKGVAVVFLVPVSEWSKPDEELLPKGCVRVICSIDGLESSKQDLDTRKGWFGTNASSEILARDLKNLLYSGRHSDIVLKCGKRRMYAHTNILYSRSRVFENLRHECEDGVLTIDAADESIFAQLLSYIYSGSIGDVSQIRVSKLCEAAAKYGLEDLKNKCFLAMRANLGKENVCDYLVVADALSNYTFKDAAIGLLIEMDELLNSDEWKDFFSKHSRIGNEVLRAVLDRKSKRISFLMKRR